ncbi:MAG: DoxX family protein [Chitinophagaceae bacterium]|nr:DoxX family protein [Chitinophagaceae bacterium]
MPLLNSKPLWPGYGLGIARIVTGFFMAYHGYEVFDVKTMQNYASWPIFQKFPSPEITAYIGKGLELVSGILLLVGLWTRLASVIMIAVMAFVTFVIADGQFWYRDQHPFLFILLGWIFITQGPGAFSIDRKR